MEGLPGAEFQKEAVILSGDQNLNLSTPSTHLHKRGIKDALIPLLRLIREKRPDFVMTTMSHANFGLLLLKPFLPSRTKIIIREASLPSAVAENDRLGNLNKFFYRHLYPCADAIISPAQIIIDEFLNDFGHKAEKHHLLYNPVPVKDIQEKSLISTERPDVTYFVSVGRLHKAKGYDRLIQELRQTHFDKEWRLDVIGDGPEEANLKALIQETNLEKNIHLRGHLDNPWPLMRLADAVLLPSRWEGLPNVVLEALSLGTPVIASADAGGIHEIRDLLTRHDILQIAEDMGAFVDLMQKTKPRSNFDVQSFLPETFGYEHCMKAFADLLQSI